MTKESYITSSELLSRIREVDDAIAAIKPYLHESTELEIKVKKGLMGCTADDVGSFTLTSDSPLWLAIGASLIDLKEELQEKFDNLKCNSKEKNDNPIEKTSFWKKVWG